METRTPHPHRTPSVHVRSIGLDIVLTIFTCMLFNFYVQYRQMEALNAMLKEERYSFVMWLLLLLVTCGLYHIYHEYKKSSDLVTLTNQPHSNEPIIMIILTVIGLGFIGNAIQQSTINAYFGNENL